MNSRRWMRQGAAALACGLLLALLATTAGALPLWTLSGDSNRIYILGSIHFLRAGQDPLPRRIVAAYEDADVLIMELDLDDVDPMQAAVTLQQLGMDPGGRNLEALLGPQGYATAQVKARALGFDLATLQPFEPWLAAITVTQVQLAQLGFSADAGVEQQLLQLARRDHKEVRGLETLEHQLSALDGLTPAAQRDFLLETLSDAATVEERIDDIVAAWKAGDLTAMEHELLDSVATQPELYRRIVVERNRNWVRQIEQLKHSRQNYLVVVGTLHLVGPDSVIQLLSRSSDVTASSPGAPDATADARTPDAPGDR